MNSKKSPFNNIAIVALFIIVILSLWPLILMVTTSFKTQGTLTRTIRQIKIADFTYTNYENLLGGPIYTKATGSSRIHIEYRPHGNNVSNNYLHIDFQNEKEGSSFVYLRISQDIRRFRSIDFDLRTKIENPKIFLLLQDVNQKFFRIPLAPMIEVNDGRWQKISIKLKDIDLSKVDEGISEKLIENIIIAFGEENKGEVAIDNVIFRLKGYTISNFKDILFDQKFGRYFINSAIIAICVTIGNVFFTGMIGYTFARKNFFGKNILFFLIMASMMIPPQVFMVPMFILMKNLGWLNTYLALIVPALVAPFNIFIMRQYISKIPRSIDDIARSDGATEFQIFFRIIAPMSKPALTIVGINTFMGSWNTFLYPFLLTNTPEIRTLPVGLALYKSIQGVDWAHLMAGSTLTALPIVVVFLLFQKYIITGITPERSVQFPDAFRQIKGVLVQAGSKEKP